MKENYGKVGNLEFTTFGKNLIKIYEEDDCCTRTMLNIRPHNLKKVIKKLKKIKKDYDTLMALEG